MEACAGAGQQQHAPLRQLNGARIDRAAHSGCPPHCERIAARSQEWGLRPQGCRVEAQAVHLRGAEGRNEVLYGFDCGTVLQAYVCN